MSRRIVLCTLALLLTACAALMGPPLQLGVSTPADANARHGKPALQWRDANGVLTQAYTTGPAGTSTLFTRFDAQQRLLSYQEVLDSERFALIKPGMSMEEVEHLVGPPYHPWTVYFKARDELAWEWRYCDAWHEISRFNVLFDGTSKLVRSTLSLTEAQRFGGWARPCGGTYIHLGTAR